MVDGLPDLADEAPLCSRLILSIGMSPRAGSTHFVQRSRYTLAVDTG